MFGPIQSLYKFLNKHFMRIAVFSDIHGNPFATRVVLDATVTKGSFDAVVSTGDICSGGNVISPIVKKWLIFSDDLPTGIFCLRG